MCMIQQNMVGCKVDRYICRIAKRIASFRASPLCFLLNDVGLDVLQVV